MLRYVISAFALLLACSNNNDTPAPELPPCPEDDLACQLDRLLNDSLARFGGQLYVQIEHGDSVLYSNTWGSLDSNSVRPLASCSKWLTSATVLAMVDSGYLSLDDTIGAYLPIFTANGKGSATLRQLLAFTSGFAGDSPQRFEFSGSLTMTQAVDSLADYMPLSYTPGSTYHYGSSHMHIAAQMCREAYHAATGQMLTWDELFKRMLAEPLGMSNAFYNRLFLPLTTDNVLPAGGAECAPWEYMRFLRMLQAGGLAPDGSRILSQASLDEMFALQTAGVTFMPQAYPSPPQFNNYGNSTMQYGQGCFLDPIAVSINGPQAVEAFCPGAFGSHPFINLEDGTIGIFFTFDNFRVQAQNTITLVQARHLIREYIAAQNAP